MKDGVISPEEAREIAQAYGQDRDQVISTTIKEKQPLKEEASFSKLEVGMKIPGTNDVIDSISDIYTIAGKEIFQVEIDDFDKSVSLDINTLKKVEFKIKWTENIIRGIYGGASIAGREVINVSLNNNVEETFLVDSQTLEPMDINIETNFWDYTVKYVGDSLNISGKNIVDISVENKEGDYGRVYIDSQTLKPIDMKILGTNDTIYDFNKKANIAGREVISVRTNEGNHLIIDPQTLEPIKIKIPETNDIITDLYSVWNKILGQDYIEVCINNKYTTVFVNPKDWRMIKFPGTNDIITSRGTNYTVGERVFINFEVNNNEHRILDSETLEPLVLPGTDKNITSIDMFSIEQIGKEEYIMVEVDNNDRVCVHRNNLVPLWLLTGELVSEIWDTKNYLGKEVQAVKINNDWIFINSETLEKVEIEEK